MLEQAQEICWCGLSGLPSLSSIVFPPRMVCRRAGVLFCGVVSAST